MMLRQKDLQPAPQPKSGSFSASGPRADPSATVTASQAACSVQRPGRLPGPCFKFALRRMLQASSGRCAAGGNRFVQPPEPEARLARSPGSACDDACSPHPEDNLELPRFDAGTTPGGGSTGWIQPKEGGM
jgi:hypothetical protein